MENELLSYILKEKTIIESKENPKPIIEGLV